MLVMIANRRRSGTISRNNPIRLPAPSGSWFDRPVTLPPGRANGSTVILRGNNPQDRMSALGQKRTSRHLQPMSALPPKADVGTQSRNSLCANSGHSALRQGTSLFDHLVSALLELERNVDADCLCGLEVDHQFELDRGLDGKLARLCAP